MKYKKIDSISVYAWKRSYNCFAFSGSLYIKSLLFFLLIAFSIPLTSAASIMEEGKERRNFFYDTSGSSLCEAEFANLSQIRFKRYSSRLNREAKRVLNEIAGKMNADTNCVLVIWCGCAYSEKDQSVSWDRLEKATRYLHTKKKIPANHIIGYYATETESCNDMGFRAAVPGEVEAYNPLPPHPKMKHH